MSMRRFLTRQLLAILILADCASAQSIPPGVQIFPDLQYGRFGASNTLDLYLPRKTASRTPVIIWIHGGGWELGSKGIWPGITMVDKGFAVASINYRLSNEAKFPAQILDCRAALHWLRINAKQYRLDPDHIGVWGESAGGHLAALLGTAGDVEDRPATGKNRGRASIRIQAVVDWCGPTDLEKWTEFQAAFANLPADYPSQCIARLFGGSIEKMREPARKANPITFVSKDDPPFLIMHGDKDSLVPLSQSEMLTSALKKAGAQVEFRVLPGRGHETFSDQESLQKVEQFFNRTLRPNDDKSRKAEEAKLLAVFDHMPADQPPSSIEFYSNNRLTAPDSVNTWLLSGQTLVLCWYDRRSPTGVWVDRCIIEKNGTSYNGTNQDGAIIRGTLKTGALQAALARPKPAR